MNVSKRIPVLISLSIFCGLLLAPSAKADSYSKVEFIPQITGSTTVDSTFPITFKITGGIASKSTDCIDVTGLQVGLGITDGQGNYSYLASLDTAQEGLWSKAGWTTKIIPQGLECTYLYSGALSKYSSTVFRNAIWIFGAPPQSDLPPLTDSSKATKLVVAWQSPITGLNFGKGGQAQTVADQSGSWAITLGGSIAPTISFNGINRGDKITLPTVVNVSAISNVNLPITEFTFGVKGGGSLWKQNPFDNTWQPNFKSTCSNLNTIKNKDGTNLQTATCLFTPESDTQNAELWAVGYVSDHRTFISQSIYVSTEKLKPFVSTDIKLSPIKDSSGNYSSGTVSGTIQKLPAGTSINICLKGHNPSNSSEDFLQCRSVGVDKNGSYSLLFSIPQVWNIHYYIESLASPFEIGNIGTTATYGDWENSKYACQNTAIGCLTAKQKASLNTSHYSQGYSAVKNATIGELKALNFFKFFSPNKKLTSLNASKWCNQVLRLSMLRSGAFDGLGPNALSTWLKGCTAAALKIPYTK